MPAPDHIVEVHLPRAALRECFREPPEDGTIVVPGVYDLPLGATVWLRVGFEDLGAGVFVEAVVLSRWPTAGSARAGMGLRCLPSSVDAARFVTAWAHGRRELSGRAQWRYPADVPVILVTAPRGSTRIYPCALVDVSVGGARATINHRIEPGAEVRCEWRGEYGSGFINARAVWGANGRLGFIHVPARPEERVVWEQLVATVRSNLRARVVASMPEKAWNSSGGARPERGFTPTPGRGGAPGDVGRSVAPKLVEVPAVQSGVRSKRRDPRSE